MADEQDVRELPAFESRVLRTIRRHRMLEPGTLALAAVSGGADSVALLCALERLAPRLRLRLAVAHLNHGLRGAESDADEEFVRGLCAERSIPFLCERIEVGAGRRGNLEERAREARYAFLRRAAAECGAARIATAHHRDDQAETVLLHFLRGSGLDGLAGIHPVVDGLIIRPLLECTRAAILEYLRGLGLPWREDSTNADLALRRNRLRHEALPYLEKHFNPRLASTLAAQAARARETAAFLDALARSEYESARTAARSGVTLPAARVARLEPALARLVLRQGLREARGSLRGITARHIDAVLGLCRPGASGKMVQLPAATAAARRFGRLILLRAGTGVPPAFCRALPVPGLCPVPEAGLEIEARILKQAAPGARRAPDTTSARLDAERLRAGLTVRSRLPGDRYGGRGHRKVKKLLIGAKVDLERRPTLPMVACGDAVVWIPGFRPARAFAAPPGAARCVELTVRPLKSGDAPRF